MRDRIDAFLACSRFAVAGASKDRSKYGNKCLRAYLQDGRNVVALHPREAEIEGVAAYATAGAVPDTPEAITVVTPPHVTEQIVEAVAAAGVRHIWMQPGAQSPEAVTRAQKLGLSVIHGGPCLLVALQYRE